MFFTMCFVLFFKGLFFFEEFFFVEGFFFKRGLFFSQGSVFFFKIFFSNVFVLFVFFSKGFCRAFSFFQKVFSPKCFFKVSF